MQKKKEKKRENMLNVLSSQQNICMEALMGLPVTIGEAKCVNCSTNVKSDDLGRWSLEDLLLTKR